MDLTQRLAGPRRRHHRRRQRHRPRDREAVRRRGRERRDRRRRRSGDRRGGRRIRGRRAVRDRSTSPTRRRSTRSSTPRRRPTARSTSPSTTPGISPADDDSIETTELPAWDRVQRVNLKSVYLCSRAALRHMVPGRARARSSTPPRSSRCSGRRPRRSRYTASKGGVLAMTRELGVQFARQGIRVNALCPGPVNTPLLQGAVRQGPGARAAPPRPRAGRPVRRARGARGRGRVPRERRRVVHHRVDVPRRRRHQRRLRDPALSRRDSAKRDVEGMTDAGCPRRPAARRRRLPPGARRQLARGHHRAAHADHPARRRRRRAETLPSERELAVRFSVSRDTVREAIRELSDTGYLTLAPRPVRRHVRERSAAGAAGRAGRRRRPPRNSTTCSGCARSSRSGAARAAATRTLDGEARAAALDAPRGGGRRIRRRLPAARLAPAPDDRRDRRRPVARDACWPTTARGSTSCSTASRCCRATSSTRIGSTRRSCSRSCPGNEEAAAEAVREHLEGSAALLRGFLA